MFKKKEQLKKQPSFFFHNFMLSYKKNRVTSMFGKILKVEEKLVKVENLKKTIQANIINFHVVFEETNGGSGTSPKIVGEIIGMDEAEISCLLIGEIKENTFISGVIKYPSVTSTCRIVYKQELELIIGSQDYISSENLLIGSSSLYDGYKVTAKMNDFLSQHFAIIGNSGCGKSCGVASLIQNMFYYNNKMPRNAHMVIFDVYGEYHTALSKINALQGVNVKYYTTKTEIEDASSEIVSIPAYFLEVDDLAILLNVNDHTLLPILEKTLQYVAIFKGDGEKAIKYKNSIIAKSLLDIIGSGKSPNQLSDQIISTLNKFNTPELNLESPIVQPGYTRTLKQCLNIDAQGKMGALQFIIEFLNTFTTIEAFDVDRTELTYTLEDLYNALEFALMSEGMLNNTALFEKANDLRVRMHSILNSNQCKYFEYKGGYIEKEQFVKSMFLTRENDYAQVLNMNFNYVDERFAKILTKLYMKLFFNFATSLKQRASFPIHIIIEEAHRYVQNDNDINVIGYNIFDRITKEGRKYGVIIGFVTQRPSELSTTCLSQCSNFLIYRIFHPEDLKIVVSISSNLTNQDIEKLKTLRPGTALVFGSAFRVPLLTKLNLPDPMPASSNVNIENSWYE